MVTQSVLIFLFVISCLLWGCTNVGSPIKQVQKCAWYWRAGIYTIRKGWSALVWECRNQWENAKFEKRLL